MKTIIISVLLSCLCCMIQAQNKWFVTPAALTTGSGASWSDPLELRTAISNASAGDSIFVAQGNYQPPSGISFSMKSGVKIYGGFAGTETSLNERDLQAGYISILQGNNTRTVSNNNNGLDQTAILDGFTITNGTANWGGGMYLASSSPTIRNCIIRNNFGGGLYMGNSAARIENCVLAENSGINVTYGGGIQMASSNNAIIINCIFWRNSGASGGGIYVDDIGPVSPQIISCTFYGNITTGGASTAGAIYCQGRSTPSIRNCIIWSHTRPLFLATSTIVPVITNNIIQGGHLGNLKTDPLFVDANNPTGADGIWGTPDDGLRVQTGSLAHNAGTADIAGLVLPSVDMAGSMRIQGNKIDIGAYESNFTCNGAVTLYVDAGVAVSGDGNSWPTAFKTLDEALHGAQQCTSVTEILVAKGTYQPALVNSFSMMNNVKIYGGFPTGGGNFAQRNFLTNTSILQGAGNSVLYNYALNSTALLDGFTVSGGQSQSGGGMYNFQASPLIHHCTFSGNAAGASGGTGGAMYNRQNANPVITNSIFLNNTASTTGTGGGGAIWNSNSSPTISKCIFGNNSAAYGGAIYDIDQGAAGIPFYPTSPVITNTVFANNTSSGDGAAIAGYGTLLTLNNCSFVNNAAGNGGAGIDIYDCDVFINNSIFWGNTASRDADIWFETGTLNTTYSFLQVARTGTGNITGTTDPFKNINMPAGADGIWLTTDDGLILNSGSPCINAGSPDTTGLHLDTTDIAGNSRILESAIDLGAYEFDITALPVTLNGFSGILQNSMASLKWSTGTETNFRHFIIEKSLDGKQFQTQGQVPAKGSVSNYSFNIIQQESTAYYRLKMVDDDGNYKYSRILRLSQQINNKILVYPNPATDYLNIRAPKAGILTIFSASGTIVKTKQLQQGVNVVELNSLGSGIYYAIMENQQVKIIKK